MWLIDLKDNQPDASAHFSDRVRLCWPFESSSILYSTNYHKLTRVTQRWRTLEGFLTEIRVETCKKNNFPVPEIDRTDSTLEWQCSKRWAKIQWQVMPSQYPWNRGPVPTLRFHPAPWIDPCQFRAGKSEYRHRSKRSSRELRKRHLHFCSINRENATHCPNRWNHRPLRG